ncbi:hypothetical protein HNY73_015247 [Argiope bruennichi]|uniref:Uncharacterized protein n=1 Tax=Argiope bruennichi TaxID=94029 RepID=A0A8T0ERH7_ARGBR|nr:hypothetical protein HNY73_015247 [Argiope bruennichi]
MDIIQAITTRNTMGSWAQALRCHKEEHRQIRTEIGKVTSVLYSILLRLMIPLFKFLASINEVNKICQKFKNKKANATSESNEKIKAKQTPKRKLNFEKINQTETNVKKANKKRTADEDGFIATAAHLVRKVKNVTINEEGKSIKIQNQPEGIEEVALDNEVGADQAPAQPKRRRILPFFVTPRTDFKVMLSILRLEAASLKSSMSSNFLKLTVETEEEHRSLSCPLEAQGAEFKTFMLTTDRPIKVVLRGLFSCTLIEEIKEELQKEGFTVVSITQLSKF